MSRIALLAAIVLPAWAVLGGPGCNPVYAPPLWSTHYGAPGRPLQGRGQAGFGANHMFSGGPWWTFHVVEGLQLEAGTESAFLEDDGHGWLLGRLGARYTLSWRRGEDGPGWALDVEAGGGVGAGGERRDDPATPNVDESQGSSLKRLAGGVYAGAGVACHAGRWFAWFLRTRQQATAAEDVPWTHWTSAMTGPEFTIGPFVIYGAGGYAQYWNPEDSAHSPLFELGFAFRFGYHAP